MPFAPHEIENKRFVVALRGYQTDEVEAFLRAVAADYRAVLGAAGEPAESLVEIRLETERMLQFAREAEDTRQKAEQEAAELRRLAQEEATALRESAARESAELRATTNREAEACFAEIARRADELQQGETRLRQQLRSIEVALEHAKRHLETNRSEYDEEPARAAGL